MNEASVRPAAAPNGGAPSDSGSVPFAAKNAHGVPGDRSGGSGAARHVLRRVPWVWLLKFTLGLVLVAYLLRYFDFHDVWRRIESANRLYLAGAVVLMALQSICFSLRWRYLALCANANLPLSQSIIGNFELAFFSQFVPSSVAGDVVRVIRAQRSGLTLTQSFTSVFLDRVVGMVTIVFMTPFLFALAPHSLSHEGLSWAIWALGLLFVVGLVATYYLGPIISRLFGENRITRLLVTVSGAFRTLVHSLALSSFAILASVVGYALVALALMAIAAATSISIGFLPGLLAICFMTLATFLPVSIGGWGVREGAAVVAFGLFAISPADALAISILFGLVYSVIGLFGGIVWMFCGYSRPSEPH